MASRKLSRADFQALAGFRYRLRSFLRFSEEATHRHGVTPLQYALMLQIRGFPGRQWATVAELAERLQARHHGVVALVSRCEAAGWVERVASRADRRCVEVHLTAAGNERVEQLARLHRDELQSAKAGFSVPGLGEAGGDTVAATRSRSHEGVSPREPLAASGFETIVDQAPAAIVVCDCDGIVQVWNRAAEALFGFTSVEVLGGSLDIIVPERLRSAHWAAFDKAVASGCTRLGSQVRTTRALHKHRDKLYVDMSFGLVTEASGGVVGSVAVARDCTERHLATRKPAA